MKRKIAAILAADVAGYSRLVSEDEEDTLTRLASYRDVFEDFVGKAGGRVFSTAGDAVLAEFGSAVEATRCAIDIQESLRTRNLGYQSTRQMLFRIGITIGDVVEREGDLLGDGVNIAARLEGLAAPGGICVSRSVYEQVANKLSVPFRDIGEQEVKNIPQPVHAFMVELRGAVAPRPSMPRSADAKSSPRRGASKLSAALAGAGVSGLLLGVAALAMVLLRSADGPAPAKPEAKPTGWWMPKVPENASPQEAFAILAKTGGIVINAKSAPELYHNARSYEARGDPAAARSAYLALASLGTDAIDPHLRFAALLRAEDGRAGAREFYARLQERTGGRAAALVEAMQHDGEERRRLIENFVSANPGYGPAQFLLSEEYSEERLGAQTLAEKRRELEALDGFLKADADGRLVPFFLDQSFLAEWLERARKRHAALDTFLRTATLGPTGSFMRSNAGWTIALQLPEAATALSYRLGGTGEFVSTGKAPLIDPRTGKPFPNMSFELPGDAAATTIEVRYDDASGRSQGPFPIKFEPRAALISGEHDILERFWNSWISFGEAGPQQGLVYFTQLVSYRCAIAAAHLGFDDGPLSVALPLPKCDERNPTAIPPGAETFLPLPHGAKSVSVQLSYRDGTRSATKAFRPP